MKVNVVIVSYNLAKYITQCLDSVLAQKGNFSLQLIIGDDGSTDGTLDILQDYQQKYASSIVVLTTTKNLGFSENMRRCFECCDGSFIAMCDGDDYWTDRKKIQRQVNFLQRHHDYAMCFNAIKLLYENEGRIAPHLDQLRLKKGSVSIEALIQCNYIANTSCCLMRTEVIKSFPSWVFDGMFGDWLLGMMCGQFGKLGFIKRYMSIYRVHGDGSWSSLSDLEQSRRILGLADKYNKLFNYKYDKEFTRLKDIYFERYSELKMQIEDN